MLVEQQELSDGLFVTWAWTTKQAQQPEKDEANLLYIENMRLDCGEINVDESHECDGRRVA